MAADPNSRIDSGGPGTLVSCCSNFYEQHWVRVLADDSFHPGGADLTRRTAQSMRLRAGDTLLDIGCGTGTSALLLNREFDCAVVGIDTSAMNIGRAASRAGTSAVRFVTCDAHVLPFDDNTFDGVIAECVFSLLADKSTALAELRRVLRPGGRIGFTDMAIADALPVDMAAVIEPWACLSDARDEQGYRTMFADAGLAVKEVVDESSGLIELLRTVKLRMILVAASELGGTEPFAGLGEIRYWLDRFSMEVGRGSIRYLRYQLES